MNILNKLPKFLSDLFIHFFKGAKIDAALIKQGRGRYPGVKTPKPGAKLIEQAGVTFWDEKDLLTLWKIETRGKLILKNNSKNPAYNIELLNAEKIFQGFNPIEKLTSLEPNKSLEIDVVFIQNKLAYSGVETEALPDIPENIEDRILIIQYTNEARTKFKTKFLVSFDVTQNEYTF